MNKITAHLLGNTVSSNDTLAFSLFEKSRFGEKKGDKIQYMLAEALFLVETNKLQILQKTTILKTKDLQTRFKRIDKKFQTKYPIYKDLRTKGYIVKTALKFGADFRVYPKGKKPGKEHAQWVVFCEHESKKISWQEFSAKNRVAHSTKKKLLLAILDEEEDVSYYEVGWIKP